MRAAPLLVAALLFLAVDPSLAAKKKKKRKGTTSTTKVTLDPEGFAKDMKAKVKQRTSDAGFERLKESDRRRGEALTALTNTVSDFASDSEAIKWLRSQPRLSKLLDESPEMAALFSGESPLDKAGTEGDAEGEEDGEDAALEATLRVAPTVLRLMPQLRRLSDELGELADEVDDAPTAEKLEELRGKLSAIPAKTEVEGLEKMVGAMTEMQKLGGLKGIEKMAEDLQNMAGKMKGMPPGSGDPLEGEMLRGSSIEQLRKMAAGLGALGV